MKIKELTPFILHVPVTRDEIADSTHAITHWGMPGVMITAEDGTTGYGYTGTHAFLPLDRVIVDCIEHTFGPLLIGKDVMQVESLNETMIKYSPALWVGRGGITQMAISAIDIALWDLKAKVLQMPLWKLLGGQEDTHLEAYNTDAGWLNWPQELLVDDCRKQVEEAGFRGIKIKVGKASAVEDLQRVEVVRKAIGDDIKLMVDANGRWDLNHATRVGVRLQDFDIIWFEEPMWHHDINGHAQLARQISTPIALGELLYSIDDFRHFINAGAVHFVQVDAVRVGGITQWWKVADLAYGHRLPVVPHHGDGGQAQLHLGIAHAGCPSLEYIPWTRRCFVEPMTVVDGMYQVPRENGAGTTLKPEAMEQFGVK